MIIASQKLKKRIQSRLLRNLRRCREEPRLISGNYFKSKARIFKSPTWRSFWMKLLKLMRSTLTT